MKYFMRTSLLFIWNYVLYFALKIENMSLDTQFPLINTSTVPKHHSKCHGMYIPMYVYVQTVDMILGVLQITFNQRMSQRFQMKIIESASRLILAVSRPHS